MPLRITSLQNARIKNVVKLNNRRHRDAECLTVVEGVPEIGRALQSGVIPREAYVCPPLIAEAEATEMVSTLQRLGQRGSTQLFEVTPDVFAKMAYRGASGGLLLVIPYLKHTLPDLSLSLSPFLVVIEGVEKPGNLGAILRTADAAGVDGVIVTAAAEQRSGTDIHNPNVVRASLGTLFTVPVVSETTDRVIDWLRQKEIVVVATAPNATVPYTAVDMTQPVALIMGSEAHGLSEQWLQVADERVVIPMVGVVDSLNLAVSTALLLYEAVRQRSER